jgi:hypothetical protein
MSTPFSQEDIEALVKRVIRDRLEVQLTTTSYGQTVDVKVKLLIDGVEIASDYDTFVIPD